MNDAGWRRDLIRQVRLRTLLGGVLLFNTLWCWADRPVGDSLRLVGAQLPPYSYESDGQVGGLGADIYRELARRVGHSGKIQVMPFKRAFLSVQNQDNLLVSPVARVPKREGLVNWAIHYLNDAFFYVTRAGEPSLTHALARNRGMIGVLRGSAPLAQLQQNDVTNYLEQTTDSVNIKLLQAGRIDAWFTSAILLSGALKANPDLKLSDFVMGQVQSSHCVYIVASNRVDTGLIQPWIDAFETMKVDGSLTAILQRHLDNEVGLMGLLGDLNSDACGVYDEHFSALQTPRIFP